LIGSFRSTFAPALLGSLLVVASPNPALAQSPADVAAARELFREGAKHAQEQRWAEARESYTKSLMLKRAPLTLYSLGVADQNLGRFVEALESFRAFLFELDPKNDAFKPYEQPARDAIAALAKRVGRIELHFLPYGVELSSVSVDGELIPKAALGVARVVDPGEHLIIANAPNRRESRNTIKVGESQSVTLDVKLFPAGPIIGPEPPPPPPQPTPYLAYSLLGGGGAVVVAGLAVGLVGVQKASDAPAQNGREADTARTLALTGDILTGIGLATMGAGLAVLLSGGPDSPPSSSPPASPASSNAPSKTSFRPVFSPGFVGVVGRF